MNKKQGFKILKTRSVFKKGPVHLLDCDVKLAHGTHLSRQILKHPGAAVVLPRLDKDRYLLVRQFRFAAESWMWEFPAGGLEKRESARNAARRELREETGMRPRKLTRILDFYPTPGLSSEVMYLFLAENLVHDHLPPDQDEELQVKAFSLREIGRLITSGRITDGKTILGYLCLKYGFRVIKKGTGYFKQTVQKSSLSRF